MKIISSPKQPWLFALLCGSILLISSCETNPSATATSDKMDTTMHAPATASTFSPDMLSNQKDPACGMPVSAGISDTAHYNNYVLGFCSSECKAEFIKNPAGMIAAAELKKEK